MKLLNDNFIRALRREQTDHTPIWLMRQAGRYLPEYCLTRKKAGDFMSLCKSPQLACEVTMQPLERFDLDAAILFSDILTIPDAMGLGLSFTTGEGPQFAYPLRDENAINKLKVPDPYTDLKYVMDAVVEIRKSLARRVPLIGFSGSPYTLACYMIEGGGSKDFRYIKSMLYQRPDLLHKILDINAQAVTKYLNAQVESGAEVLMLFDTWGGSLSHEAYKEFSLQYISQILSSVHRQYNGEQIPVIVFTKGGGLWLEEIANCGCDAVGLDWTIDIAKARKIVNGKVALQGNLDPNVLFASSEVIKASAEKIMADYAKVNPKEANLGHIFNLGHGISQFTPPESVSALVSAVHDFKI